MLKKIRLFSSPTYYPNLHKKSALSLAIIIITLFLFLSSNNIYAGQIDFYEEYTINGEVNYLNLNGNFRNIINEFNGGIDNINLRTNFRMIEILGSLPVAEIPGRAVYLTTEDVLYLDDGALWWGSPTYQGTPAQGEMLYFNGTNWVRLGVGSAGNTLRSGGSAANLSWAALNLAGGVTYISGILPITNGGTGSATDNLIYDGDAAGGDLTGTYPNPTLETGIPKNVQAFTSSGTWTRPAGIDYVLVKIWGGGGGGGGGDSDELGAGGGGGGYTEEIVEVTGDVTVTVGGGGSGVSGAAGNAGGTSSFAGETTPQATGGGGGTKSGAGGAGGVGSVGTVNLTGAVGGNSPTTGSSGASGAGGAAPMGGDGGKPAPFVDMAPTTGAVPGGGGGGAKNPTAGDSIGAAGADGLVIVYY